jgi:Tat protein secretion system quality control protein TatD with DNase activity
MAAPAAPAYVDIGANLLSEQFAGKYHGKRAHAADLDAVLQRADAAGVSDIIITAGTLRESQRALALARATNASGKYAVRLHSTVGVHPTNTKQLDGEPDRGSDDDHGGSGSGDGAGHAHAGGGGGGGKRQLTKEEYVSELEKVIVDGLTDGVVVSIGECGLDYDRCVRQLQPIKQR